MANNWTKEQLEAITERDSNLLVAAAAGAGKTAVLVERIIKRITDDENPVDIDRLLVVTFTNAAATEMRERIGNALADALEATPSSANLQKQMALLDRASIMTLHSFCLEVVRNHFHALDIDPLFRIADETEGALMRLDALDQLFEERYENEDKDSIFFQLVDSFGGGRDDSALREIIMTLHRFTASHPWPGQWLAAHAEAYSTGACACLSSTPWARVLLKGAAAELQGLSALLERAASRASLAEGLEPYCGVLEADIETVEELLALCQDALKKVDINGTPSDGPASMDTGEVSDKSATMCTHTSEASNKVSAADIDEAWDRLHATLSSYAPARLPRCGKNVDKAAQDEVKTARNTMKERIKKLNASGFDASSADIRKDFSKLYPQLKYLCNMVLGFDEKYRHKKKEKGLLDFNDLEHYCLKVLLEDGKPTAAARELRERYDEILVDEYQDSNLIQELILGTVSGNQDGIYNIFMVGDVKQSIYRFRQARPELFLSKYMAYPHEKGHESRVIQLYKNFRSRPEVINGVNFIFRQIMSSDVGELDYTENEYLNPGAEYAQPEGSCITGGAVELHVLDLTSSECEIIPGSEKNADAEDEIEGGAAGSSEASVLADTSADADKEASTARKELLAAEDKKENSTKKALLSVSPKSKGRLKGTDQHDGYYDSESNSIEEESLDNIQYEARIVGNRIKELVTYKPDGFNVYDKKSGRYRPAEYRDIVILMRATRNWADVFTDELALMGIPAYADTGLGYFRTVEVETMLSLLQIIDNPLQDIPMLAVLRSPIGGFSTDELADIRLADRSVHFYEAMQKLAEGATGTTTAGSVAVDTDIAAEPATAAEIITTGAKAPTADAGIEAVRSIEAECNEDYDEQIAVIHKTRKFLSNLHRWRDIAQHTPTDDLVWQLLSETGYYSYVGVLPGGVERQANLRMLFERARQYEETSYRGLFNFISFINKLRSGGGDMGSAKILGENDNVVRIMSIHKSKGLEFPIVIVAGCGKRINMQDLNPSILLHQDLGFGPDLVDLEKRTIIPSLPKLAIRQKLRLETLSEEMRILYVAFTRAREKLIITGCVRDINKVCTAWCANATGSGETLSSYAMMQASTYLDWIGSAVARHRSGHIIRLTSDVGEDIMLTDNEKSLWDIKLWGTGAASMKKEMEEAGESIMDWLKGQVSETTSGQTETDRFIKALEWNYPYQALASIPAKVSVTELKRRFLQEERSESAVPFIQPMAERPMFMEPEKELSAAHKGTVMHFVMQHLDLSKLSEIQSSKLSEIQQTKSLTDADSRISSIELPDDQARADTLPAHEDRIAGASNMLEEIRSQLVSMIARELLTAAEADSVKPQAIEAFLGSSVGKRMLDMHDFIHRETAFNIEIKCSEIYRDLPSEQTENEMMLLQGVIDCWFETEEGIVLLDYKTDYVPAGGAELVRERYRVQIDYYTKALEKITGKRVAERYLYLFYSGELLQC